MADATAPKRHFLINTAIVPPGGFRYIQPESGKLISGSSWQQLRQNVIEHRRANKYPIGTDLDAELQDWLCGRIADAGMHCYLQGRQPVKTYPGAGPEASGGTGYQGQAKWRELHLYALTEQPTPFQRIAWLANFAASLPCGECKKSWKALVKQKPLPQNASDAEFFAWGVERHNDVSRKLGKPELTVEQARAIYL